MPRVKNIQLNSSKIFEEANFYLKNNFTMAGCAEKFGISKKTFQTHMKQLEELDKELFEKVQDKKQNNLKEGAKKGGSISKPTSNGNNNHPHQKSISDDQINALAHLMVENELTYRELEEISGIPKSTLQDNFTKERLGDYYDTLKGRVDKNKADTNKGLV